MKHCTPKLAQALRAFRDWKPEADPREAALMEAVDAWPRGREHGQVRPHWSDQARFRYNGKRNAKRKGTIRNHEERRVLARL